MSEVTVLFTCDSIQDAEIIEQSLSPEIHQKIPKSDVSLTRSGKILTLTVKSSDVSSLRASCNSYLRWIQTVLAVNNVV